MKKAILTLSVITMLLGCSREINISSVALKTRLVVNALLNDQDKIAISVSISTVIQDSVKPAPLKNAIVTITDKNGVKTSCIYSLASQEYECNIVPKAGDFFAVVVSAPGYQDAYAQLTMPQKATAGKSTWKDSVSYDSSGFPNGRLTVNLNDNGNEKNYYRISLFYYQTATGDWNTLQPVLDDAELENQALKTQDGGIIFTDVLFNGRTRSIGFITPYGYGAQSPKFLAVIENLSQDYYQYFKSLDNYKKNSGVFSEPLQVYSNIQNGLGIFAASSMQRDTIQ